MQCHEKKRYLSEESAKATIKRIKDGAARSGRRAMRPKALVKDYERLHAYRCEQCTFWHVGHARHHEVLSPRETGLPTNESIDCKSTYYQLMKSRAFA
jgi:hypothetical protein